MTDWKSESAIEKQFKMKRAMAQSVGHRMKTDDLVDIFPDKKVGNNQRVAGQNNNPLLWSGCGLRNIIYENQFIFFGFY